MDYVSELLKRADVLDQTPLVKALQVARYAKDRSGIRSAVLADMLERVHRSWNSLNGWLNTHIDRDASPFLLEWMFLESAVDQTRLLAQDTKRTSRQEIELSSHLWEVVVMLSDPKWIRRILDEADQTHHGHMAWQLMGVRLACKTAIMMIEFDPQFDAAVDRF